MTAKRCSIIGGKHEVGKRVLCAKGKEGVIRAQEGQYFIVEMDNGTIERISFKHLKGLKTE